METAPLKSFATWARTSLIREVTARITAVLAPGSTERVEQPGAVAALEKEVQAAGGGDKGRASVADTVAYTWFNRIIALRFMDANGYTGIGVVSPQAGVDLGQPEILAEAKRGVIDTEVVSKKTCTTVTGLLDGSRASGDPQGEAYALLLADYCRHWNKSMPFMFEREGDFTELLIPANLLSDDSVLNRAVKILTEEVCQDVEVIGWLYQFFISERKDEVFAGFKRGKKAAAEEIPAATQLFTPHWIVRYLVENSLGRLWMLNRPTSRLVDRMDYYIPSVDEETEFLKIAVPEELTVMDPACGSGHMLTYAFDLLYAIYEEEGYAPSEIPSQILTHNLHGLEIDSRAGALAAFALTMKARSRQRSFFVDGVEPKICVLRNVRFTDEELEELTSSSRDQFADEDLLCSFEHADTFGSLARPDASRFLALQSHMASAAPVEEILAQNLYDRAEIVLEQAAYLTRSYSVLVANPPYMGSKNFGSTLAELSKRHYPESKADLYAMFIQRSVQLVCRGGRAALVTIDSWMFQSRLTPLRVSVLTTATIDSLLHMPYEGQGPTAMSISFGLSAFVLTPSDGSGSTEFRKYRYTDFSPTGGVREFDSPSERHVVGRTEFNKIPGMRLAYWASETELAALGSARTIEDIAPTRQGFESGGKEMYVRFWWEVSREAIGSNCASVEDFHNRNFRFAPYLKGGEWRRWFGNDLHVIRFDRSVFNVLLTIGNKLPSREHYFKDAITWSDISTKAFGARYAGPGSVFSALGPAALPEGPAERNLALAVLNSSLGDRLLRLFGGTLHFNVGDVKTIPVPTRLPAEVGDALNREVETLIEIFRNDWNSRETSPGFDVLTVSPQRCRLIDAFADARASALAQIDKASSSERALDVLVSRAFASSELPVRDLETSLQSGGDLAVDLVSFAVGCMFGRYSLDEPGLILADQGATLRDYLAKVPSPIFIPDADNVIPIVDGDWFEDGIVERFRQFVRAAFGEEHFEENLRFVIQSLGVKSLRDYFVKSFYKDHVQRYKKRPIYWLFSSPNGSFNALIYMHRYTPSTVSTVLNEYLREFQAKLKASLKHAERSNNGKEADRLRKILMELDGYEHDVLYPLASQNVAIDLDDGVKVNYPKFGAALKKIPGLEASE